jgi:hypothetical protein
MLEQQPYSISNLSPEAINQIIGSHPTKSPEIVQNIFDTLQGLFVRLQSREINHDYILQVLKENPLYNEYLSDQLRKFYEDLEKRNQLPS